MQYQNTKLQHQSLANLAVQALAFLMKTSFI